MGFPAPHKLSLVPASYNGVVFYVELQARQGGFRIAKHEFPKKDIGWSENMGRRLRHWSVIGYLVYSPVHMPDVNGARNALIAALEISGPGTLILPSGLHMMSDEPPGAVVVETYAVAENWEKGGWVGFEMNFIEAGQSPSSMTTADTQGAVNSNAGNLLTGAQTSSDINSPLVTQSGMIGATPSIYTSTSPVAFDVNSPWISQGNISPAPSPGI